MELVVVFARANRSGQCQTFQCKIMFIKFRIIEFCNLPWAHLWRKFEVGGSSRKEESEVWRKMFSDMELHVARSKIREKWDYKRLLLFLQWAEILFRMVYFSETCTYCSCIQVWKRENSFPSFLSTMYHSLCFLSYKISTSSCNTKDPPKKICSPKPSEVSMAYYG